MTTTESALDAERSVLALMWEYAENKGLKLSTVSRKCSGSGSTAERIQNGGSVTGARLTKMVVWLREAWEDSWPQPEWPTVFELSESKIEFELHRQLCQADIPHKQQMEFGVGMRQPYRADFAWPQHRLLVEVEGGMWKGGKHAIALHEQRRQKRRCIAQALGWSILEVHPVDVRNGRACDLIRQWLIDPSGVPPLLRQWEADDAAKEAGIDG